MAVRPSHSRRKPDTEILPRDDCKKKASAPEESGVVVVTAPHLYDDYFKPEETLGRRDSTDINHWPMERVVLTDGSERERCVVGAVSFLSNVIMLNRARPPVKSDDELVNPERLLDT